MFYAHMHITLKQNERFGGDNLAFGIKSFAKLLVLEMIALGNYGRSRRNSRDPSIWQRLSFGSQSCR